MITPFLHAVPGLDPHRAIFAKSQFDLPHASVPAPITAKTAMLAEAKERAAIAGIVVTAISAPVDMLVTFAAPAHACAATVPSTARRVLQAIVRPQPAPAIPMIMSRENTMQPLRLQQRLHEGHVLAHVDIAALGAAALLLQRLVGIEAWEVLAPNAMSTGRLLLEVFECVDRDMHECEGRDDTPFLLCGNGAGAKPGGCAGGDKVWDIVNIAREMFGAATGVEEVQERDGLG